MKKKRGPTRGEKKTRLPDAPAPEEKPALRELFSPLPDILTVLAVPVAILLFDHQWIFPGPQRDPWIYYGYFKGAPQWVKAFPEFYYSNRLSVILPGFLIHSVLPSLAANVLLHLAIAWLALISFYGVARALFGRPPALLSTICLGCQPFFLAAVGEGYVDGFGIAYFLAALLAATQAARRPGNVSLIAMGVFTTAVVAANIAYLFYLPIIGVHFLFLSPKREWRTLVRRLVPAGLGAVGAFLAFAAASKTMGGRLLFLWPSLSFASTTVRSPSIFWSPPALWLPEAVWLVFPGLVLLGALGTLLLTRRRQTSERRLPPVTYSQLLYAGFMAAMLAWRPGITGILFQHFFYASLSIPIAALAFAGQLSFALERDSSPVLPAAWGVAVVLVTAYALRTPEALRSFRGPVGLVPFLAGLPMIALVVLRAKGTAARLAFVVSLAASSILARDLFSRHRNFDAYGGDRAAIFDQMGRCVKAYRSVDRSGHLYFWFDQAEPAGVFYDMVAATSLSGWRIVTVGFPRFVPGGLTASGTPVARGMKIVVLSARETAWAEAEEAIRSQGLRARRIHEDRIDGPAGFFAMIFLEVVAPEAPAA